MNTPRSTSTAAPLTGIPSNDDQRLARTAAQPEPAPQPTGNRCWSSDTDSRYPETPKAATDNARRPHRPIRPGPSLGGTLAFWSCEFNISIPVSKQVHQAGPDAGFAHNPSI